VRRQATDPEPVPGSDVVLFVALRPSSHPPTVYCKAHSLRPAVTLPAPRLPGGKLLNRGQDPRPFFTGSASPTRWSRASRGAGSFTATTSTNRSS